MLKLLCVDEINRDLIENLTFMIYINRTSKSMAIFIEYKFYIYKVQIVGSLIMGDTNCRFINYG